MKLLERVRARYLVAADPLRSERRVEAAAVVLAFALCLQLLYSGARLLFMSSPEAVLPAADALRAGSADNLAIVNAQQSGEIRERPLFWQGRRRVESEEAVAAATEEPEEPAQIEGLKLVGVFGSGEAAGVIALVKGEKRRILLDESVQGWTLESVAADRAVLVSGERREELMLKQRKVIATEQAPGQVQGSAGGSGGGTVAGQGAAGQGGFVNPVSTNAAAAQQAGDRRLGGRTAPPAANGN